MSKTFAQAPKPKPPLTAEIISVFERGGAGQDTQSHIATKVEMSEPVKAVNAEALCRLSIDLPKSLHRRFKTACAKTDLKMVTEVMEFIERRTIELENS